MPDGLILFLSALGIGVPIALVALGLHWIVRGPLISGGKEDERP
jgi:hypothetical protein